VATPLAEWRRYGRALKTALWANVCVVEISEYQCGWMDGGCFVAARAVSRLVNGTLWAITTTENGDTAIDHVVVRTADGAGFLDGEGFASPRGMLQRWKKLLGVHRPRAEVKLVEMGPLYDTGDNVLVPDLERASEVRCDVQLAEELERRLRAAMTLAVPQAWASPFLYHGTLASHLPGLAREGLRAPSWMSRTVEFAGQWAHNRSSEWIDGELKYRPTAVLRVRSAGLSTAPDPNLPGEPRSVMVRQAVPPEDLDVLIGDPWKTPHRWKKLTASGTRRGNPVPCGDCYAFANQAAQDRGATVVHATVTDPWTKEPRPHAWAEHHGYATDFQGQHRPIAAYHALYRPTDVVRYTPAEALVLMLRTGHHGPWEGEPRPELHARRARPPSVLPTRARPAAAPVAKPKPRKPRPGARQKALARGAFDARRTGDLEQARELEELARKANPLLPFGVIYLTGMRTPTLDAVAGYHLRNANAHDESMPLGVLVQPLTRHYLRDGAEFYPWVGIDNGCFTESGQRRFKMDAYLRMIGEALDAFGEDAVLFATAQDVAFDWEATLEKSLPTLPLIRKAGAPAALVVQDGATPENIPWDELDSIFVGGSTEWKLSPSVAAIAKAANRRHKWVHMGRVNSLQRITTAQRFGCRSADGTYLLHEEQKGRGEQGVETMISWLRDSWKRDPARRAYAQAER